MGRSLTFAILPLAAFETLIWAATFYSFPALLPVWEADTGWGRGELSGALTASLIVTALASPRMGGLIDRGYARVMLLCATALGAALLVALSMVQTLWQFWAVWIAIGLVNACVLYEACFAIITVTVGVRAKQAITVVTLMAGFAGTVCFPAFHFLSEYMGWRFAVQVFAGIVLLGCLPLAHLGLTLIERFRDVSDNSTTQSDKTSVDVTSNPVFWWVALGFASMGLIHGMIISHIRPILAECGLALAATVLVASLIGPMQVLGRVILVAIGDRIDTFAATVGAFLGVVIGLALLAGSGLVVLLAFVFVVPYGASYGVFSILRPVLAAEFLGRERFGMIAGWLALPYVFAGAIGPILSAGLWSIGGYDLVLALSGGLVGFAIFSLFLARGHIQRSA
ncbi:MAG: MFS transporter [Pseudomonadota bacterium]